MNTEFRTLISSSELHAILGQAEVVIVDCRFRLSDPDAGRQAYLQAHIPGARYAHLNEDLSGPIVPGVTGRHPLPTPDALARTLARFAVTRDTQLIAYDDDVGAIAARLWWLCRWLGHDRVAVLDGGWTAWQHAGLPVDDSVPAPAPSQFEPSPRPQLLGEAAVVAAMVSATDCRVFDAREVTRYRGESEPIDAVAGHIPGAHSLPFSGNVTEGRLLPRDQLRARFSEALGQIPASRSIVYCGSGVTACHNILAASHAGYDGMLLYPGSWSEWIADPSRPVARGDR